jgi:hypothetical protein
LGYHEELFYRETCTPILIVLPKTSFKTFISQFSDLLLRDFMCDYELEPGKKCPLERFIYTPFCALHTDFPEDKKGGEYLDLLERKNKKIQEKIQSGNYDFRGVIIKDFILPDESQVNTSILFNKAKIMEDV